ncbi:MAG: hypothetical protein JWO89_3196 [Verrucomicrobiaceae bacterium]|nr:hypothetical protein [Verrucomicrobiaceae bacterium]MDB6120277.1 hypothetical protein [Verrucomicrobiaceae bacterium]
MRTDRFSCHHVALWLRTAWMQSLSHITDAQWRPLANLVTARLYQQSDPVGCLELSNELMRHLLNLPVPTNFDLALREYHQSLKPPASFVFEAKEQAGNRPLTYVFTRRSTLGGL